MERFDKLVFVILALGVTTLYGCQDMVPQDVQSLLIPRLQRSEIVGIVAGFGTTFAAVPDLVTMFRHRSSSGIKPTMAAITGVFQILWIYYGLLIASRPVIVWNLMGVLVNFLIVAAYMQFVRKEQREATR